MQLEIESLPVRIDRRTAAQIISRYYFPVSPRTLERWPVPYRQIAGRALYETADILREAERRLREAPSLRGHRWRKSSGHEDRAR